jgi:hypothetical protein
MIEAQMALMFLTEKRDKNDQFEKWLNSKYGIHGKVTAACGKVHDYLGMELDYQKRG